MNPLSITYYIKLVKLYLDWAKEDKSKIETAFNYVVKVETRKPFFRSIEWYSLVHSTLDVSSVVR